MINVGNVMFHGYNFLVCLSEYIRNSLKMQGLQVPGNYKCSEDFAGG